MKKDITEIHIPVLLERALELLADPLDRKDAVFVDCTLGLGGHSEAIAKKFPNATIVGIDRDSEALEMAKKRLEQFSDRVHFANYRFDKIKQVLDELGIEKVDGVLFDLGVSSFQLDEDSRGFAYSRPAPLDMRMDSSDELDAETIINTYSERELSVLFKKYGDEPLAKRYARAIVDSRQKNPIKTSSDLVDILQEATPYPQKQARHPAKRVFQALRVEVNGELTSIEKAIPDALEVLKLGGRVLAMSYQSLEDKLVKQIFKDAVTSKTPAELPFEIEALSAKFKLLLRGSEAASEEEKEQNPRSKPVRLRAIERTSK